MNIKKTLLCLSLGFLLAQPNLQTAESYPAMAQQFLSRTWNRIRTTDTSKIASETTKYGSAILYGSLALGIVGVTGYYGYSALHRWYTQPSAEQLKETEIKVFFRSMYPIYQEWARENDEHIIIAHNHTTNEIKIYKKDFEESSIRQKNPGFSLYTVEDYSPECIATWPIKPSFITSQESYEEFVGKIFLAYLLQYKTLPNQFVRFDFNNIDEAAFAWLSATIRTFALQANKDTAIIHPKVINALIKHQVPNSFQTAARAATQQLIPAVNNKPAPIRKFEQLRLELVSYCSQIPEKEIAGYFNERKDISSYNALANQATYLAAQSRDFAYWAFGWKQ